MNYPCVCVCTCVCVRAAFSLFGHSDDLQAEPQKKHDEMILLLKKAKVRSRLRTVA